MKKHNVYYATEENCFEGELIQSCGTIEEAKSVVAENLKDDIGDEGRLNEAISEITEKGWEGINDCGYEIIYVIGGEDYCKKMIEEERERMLKFFEDAD